MLANKNDPTNVKMIDFGLSKDFSGQETMKTMSGSVSENYNRWLTFLFLFFDSPTISPQRCSSKTTTRKLTSGHSASSSTSCSPAKCHSQATQSSKLLVMLSKVTFISITSRSHDIVRRLKNSYNVSSKRTYSCDIQQSRHSIIHGSKIISSCHESLSTWKVKASQIRLRKSSCARLFFLTFARRWPLTIWLFWEMPCRPRTHNKLTC